MNQLTAKLKLILNLNKTLLYIYSRIKPYIAVPNRFIIIYIVVKMYYRKLNRIGLLYYIYSKVNRLCRATL